MKSLFNGLMCASLLAFVVGCGKDSGGKSGGGISNVGVNPVVSPYISQSGQTALNNLKAWYGSAETVDMGFRGTYIKKSETISSFSFQGSFCIFGWGYNCNEAAPAPTNCFIKNGSNTYDVGTATGTALNQCSITQSNVTKATNQLLTSAVNGDGRQLLDVQQQGSIYYLAYGNNPYAPEVVYTIDTRFHSVLNPVQVQSGKTKTTITGLQLFQF